MSNEDDELERQLCDGVEALVGRSGAPSPAQMWAGLTDLGLPGMLLPEALGGSGLDIRHAAGVAEVLGRHGIENPLLPGVLAPSVALGGVSDGPLVRQLCAGIAAGRSTYPLAWQERSGRIDAHAPTTAVVAGRLTGIKLFVPASEAGFIVTARHDRLGSALLLVARNDVGVHADPIQNADGSVSATLEFRNVPAGDDRILASGSMAEAVADRAVAAGAILRAAQLCGLAAGTLEATLDYLKQRRQFGRRLAEFQVLQHRCVDLYGQTRLARASWRSAARRFAADPNAAASLAAVSAAKARCGDVANLVAKQAIQLHGAFGFTEGSGLGRTLNAALAWSMSFGNSEVHRIRFQQLSSQDKAA